MNLLKTLVGFIFSSILFNSCAQTETKMENFINLYNIAINDIDGDSIDLNDFKGKFILFVNVASKCGFTPQYKELQELHDKYKNELVIIGVPCNQFGKQEPGNASEIKSFCSKNYGVEFLITEKVDVKGEQQHPLYSWLTTKEQNGAKGSSVKWNFQKYLIDKDGKLIDFFYSITSPSSKKITKYFSK
jgi:glutathione peroxidase